MRRTLPVVTALAGVIGLVLTTAACSDKGLVPEPVDLACPVEAGGPVTLIVGARANSPAPTLSDEVKGLIREAAKQSRKVQVVRLDGAPTVTYSGTFRTTAANDVARKAALDKFLGATEAQIAGLRPKVAEADVLAALEEAGRVTPAGGTVVLMDSGLQTTGQLNFRADGTFSADPAEVVEFLDQQKLLPKLEDRAVVLVGLGNTAAPQEELDPAARAQVTAVWKAIVDKQHPACVQEIDTAQHRTSITTDVPVTPVPVPRAPVFQPCGTTVLADGGSVGFVADQAVFRDPAGARRTLEGLADKLRPGTQKVTLTGTTASAGTSEAGRVALSVRRAEAVKKVLVDLGIAADRIQTVGLGSHGPNRVPDRDKDGHLIPAKAALNRTVVVQLSCSR